MNGNTANDGAASAASKIYSQAQEQFMFEAFLTDTMYYQMFLLGYPEQSERKQRLPNIERDFATMTTTTTTC
jgi:hypothetical protein